jgi:hypothetical protein
MRRQRVVDVSAIVCACLMLVPTVSPAQGVPSSIAGVVKDTSGAILPGVTVEAASPALIEKVRTVVTDSKGEYKIIDLRPGLYTVTFTLPGFSTAKREGVDLPSNFTATVNAELRVGDLQETVTVSGAAPTVDVQNVVQQKAFTRTILDTLPTNKGIPAYGALTPGVVVPPTAQDVGGNRGELSFRMVIHDGRMGDQRLLQDGMRYNSAEGTGRGMYIDPANAQEIVVELGGGSAETEFGGVQVNLIPKEGGNRFSEYFFTNYTDHNLQTGNLTDDLRARGLNAANHVKRVYDFNGAVGGPIKQDTLWFYVHHRSWGNANFVAGSYYNKTPESYLYTPDFSRQGVQHDHNRADGVRFTWQASPRNKINLSYDIQQNCVCSNGLSATVSPEASWTQWYEPNYMFQSSWNFPMTNKLLFSAGNTTLVFDWPNLRNEGSSPDAISVLEQSINLRYRSTLNFPGGYGHKVSGQSNQRFSVSYVTGSHSLKTGVFAQEGTRRHEAFVNGSMTYTFLNGAPISLTEYAEPVVFIERLRPDLGIYVQDQWTIKRLTLNLGVRVDTVHEVVPAQQLPAGPFVPARNFAKVDCVPCWKDVNPRLSASYDLSGKGKTALKMSVGRYVQAEFVDTARLNNPVNTSVNSATRTWGDVDGNFVPDCDLTSTAANGECGALSNSAFGQLNITTHYANLTGWGNRGYNWQASASIQHELTQGASFNVGYFRTSYGNILATDNQAVTPANYDPYCITAPADSRLPGGGNQICGLYDVVPSKFGQVNNLVTFASNYGKASEVFNGVDTSFNVRLPRDAFVQGGVSTGRTEVSNCFIVNSPQALRFCDVVLPFSAQTQVKISGAYPLPRNFVASATFQNLPGIPITAQYLATNAVIAPSLGRNLASGARGTATIELIQPNALFEGRISQFDVRLTKVFKVAGGTIKGMFDVYNLFNTNSILAINSAYGRAWKTPTQILDARLFKFGAQLEF